jgi:hypothetical protein
MKDYKKYLTITLVSTGLFISGCEQGALFQSNDSSSTYAVDGYIIKLITPAIAQCGDIEYESSLEVGESGKIDFPDVTLHKDCTITIADDAIIDVDNDGKYDPTIDQAIGFEMQSFGDMQYTSHLTSLAVANPNDLELANLVKDFNPVEDVNKAIDNTTYQKLFVLGEVVKTVMKNGTNEDIKKLDINPNHIQSDDIALDEFDTSNIIANITNTEIKDKVEQKATMIKDVVKVLKDLKDDVNIKDMFIRVSDKGEKPSDAISKSIKEDSTKSISDIKSKVPTITQIDQKYTQIQSIENDKTNENIEQDTLSDEETTTDDNTTIEEITSPSILDLDNGAPDINGTNIDDIKAPTPSF